MLRAKYPFFAHQNAVLSRHKHGIYIQKTRHFLIMNPPFVTISGPQIFLSSPQSKNSSPQNYWLQLL